MLNLRDVKESHNLHVGFHADADEGTLVSRELARGDFDVQVSHDLDSQERTVWLLTVAHMV